MRDAPDRLPAAPYDGAHHVRLHQDAQREVDLAAGRVPHRAGQTAAPAEPLLMEEVGRARRRGSPLRVLLLLLALLGVALFSDGGRGRRGAICGRGYLGRHTDSVVNGPVQRLEIEFDT